jgi:hypothetical protein
MWHVWDTERVLTGFSWVDVRERDHLEDLGIDRWIILQWIFKKRYGKAWTGMMWCRIGTGDGKFVNAVMNIGVP